MCNAKPGLRCNEHASQGVISAEQKIADLMSAITEASAEEQQKLLQSLQLAEERLKEESFEYLLTNAGQEELATVIRQKRIAGEDATPLYKKLGEARRIAARRKRAAQQIESRLTSEEEKECADKIESFGSFLSLLDAKQKASRIRLEKSTYKHKYDALRSTYTEALNAGDVAVEKEKEFQSQIRKSKYLMSKIAEMEQKKRTSNIKLSG